jgi:hypothetical protein
MLLFRSNANSINMPTRLFLFLLIYIGSAIDLLAQDIARSAAQNFSVKSPDAFAFSKVSNVPVSLFTGQVQLNLPLFEKKLSVLTFKMNLNYTGGGGVKADQSGGIVGKSWFLNIGGRIIRNKRGVPDDFKNTHQLNGGAVWTRYNGILYGDGVVYKPDGEGQVVSGDPNFWYAEGIGDSQHDIFEFNFFGRSGKFYIGKDFQVLIVTDSKLKIIPNFTTSPLSDFKLGTFTIIDESGVKYHFDKMELAVDQDGSNVASDDAMSRYYYKEYGSSWVLTKVEAPFGEESITYEYTERESGSSGGSSGTTYAKRSDLTNWDFSTGVGTSIRELTIKTITFSDQSKIVFNYFKKTVSGDEHSLLKTIDIYNYNNEVYKTFSLNYSWWIDPQKKVYTKTLPEYIGLYTFSRSFTYLNEVEEVGSDDKKKPLFILDYFLDNNYNDAQYAYTASIDYWGYWNGKSNQSLSTISTQWAAAADRTPDGYFAKMGAVKKVIYSTGGYVELDYELNDKRTPTGNQSSGGVRVMSQRLHDGRNSNNDVVTEYKYIEVDGLSSGFLGDMPQFVHVVPTYNSWPNPSQTIRTTTVSFTHPMNPLSTVEGSFVGYRRVEEIYKKGNKDNGKIVYEYSDLSNTNNLWAPTDYYPYRPVDRPYWAVGLPLTTTYMSASGLPTKKIVNEYNVSSQVHVDDNFRSLHTSTLGYVEVAGSGSNLLTYIYKYTNYYPIVGRTELARTKTFDYASNGVDNTYSVTENTYDNSFYVLRKTSEMSSNGETVEKYMYYPIDYNLGTSSFTSKFLEKNMINVPISTEFWRSKGSGSYLIRSECIEYGDVGGGIFKPVTAYSSRLEKPFLSMTPSLHDFTSLLQPNRNMQPDVQFTKYDVSGRLIEFQKPNSYKQAVILNKSGDVMVKAVNAESDNLAYTNFETSENGNWTFLLSGITTSTSKSGGKSFSGAATRSNIVLADYTVRLWAKGAGNVTVNGISKTAGVDWTMLTWQLTNVSAIEVNTNSSYIDDLLLAPSQAKVNTYNYKTGIGVESIVEVTGLSESYSYDNYNRLRSITDHQGNITKSHYYNFVKPPYVNATKSGEFTRSNCPAGQSQVPGPPVTYSVPQGKYNSFISQFDADAQADSDILVNGQKYANENGVCLTQYFNVVMSQPFTKNNCPANTTPSEHYYLVPAGTYSSVISQADANAKAQNDINQNGQNYANSVGTCSQLINVSFSNSTSANFEVSIGGSGVQRVVGPGQTTIQVPSGVYTVHIAPLSGTSYTYWVGSRSAIVGSSATFYNVNISTGSSDNYMSVNN